MRLITKQTIALSHPEIRQKPKRRKREGGIRIQSAEGLRFAYAATYVPHREAAKETPKASEENKTEEKINIFSRLKRHKR